MRLPLVKTSGMRLSPSSPGTRCSTSSDRCIGSLRGGGGEEMVAGVAVHGGQAGDAVTEARHLVVPKLAASQGIKGIHVAVHADDEAVAIEEETGVAGTRMSGPLPDNLAGMPVQGGDAFIEAGEDEIGDAHGPTLHDPQQAQDGEKRADCKRGHLGRSSTCGAF